MTRRPLLTVALILSAAAPLGFAALRPSGEAAASAAPPPAEAEWAAAAPGVAEPNAGFLRLGFPEAGRIAEVRVRAGDAVRAGEVLVRLVDDEQRARVAAAEAELAFRIADRNGTAGEAGRSYPARLDVGVAAAERDMAKAQAARDAAKAGGGDVAASEKSLEAADAALQDRQAALRADRAAAATRGPADRKAAAVDAARAELAVARAECEKALLRAPVDGTVLAVPGRAGELILPSSDEPTVTMGGAGPPSVRAELDEADAGKVAAGDRAIVRSDARGDWTGHGRVVATAPLVARRRIGASSSGRPSPSDAQEVRIEMEPSTDLLPGTHVDVFFQPSGRQAKEANR